MGGQDHFYLETHIALAIPHENSEFTIWSSTQHPTEVQHGVSNVLNIPAAKISSKVRSLAVALEVKKASQQYTPP